MPRSIIDTDERLTDQDISRKLGPHKATVCRWRVKGIPLPDGSRLRLPYSRVGKRSYVHPDDLRDFLDKLTEADQQRHDSPPREVRIARAPRRTSRAELAQREAEELGI